MFVLVGATLGLALVGYVFLVRRFAAPGTSWAVRLHVGLAWLVSLSILLLVPFDIFSTRDPGNGAGVPVPELPQRSARSTTRPASLPTWRARYTSAS